MIEGAARIARSHAFKRRWWGGTRAVDVYVVSGFGKDGYSPFFVPEMEASTLNEATARFRDYLNENYRGVFVWTSVPEADGWASWQMIPY
jgi:hypothetical protein